MTMAWEMTGEDISNVLSRMGISITEKKVQKLFELLDTDLVENEALRGAGMPEQTDASYEEIERQLKEFFGDHCTGCLEEFTKKDIDGGRCSCGRIIV